MNTELIPVVRKTPPVYLAARATATNLLEMCKWIERNQDCIPNFSSCWVSTKTDVHRIVICTTTTTVQFIPIGWWLVMGDGAWFSMPDTDYKRMFKKAETK